MKVYTCSDDQTTKYLAEYIINNPSPAYIRIDRDESKVNVKCSKKNISNGFRIFKNTDKIKKFIISCGSTIKLAEDFRKKYKKEIITIDVIRQKPFPEEIIEIVKQAKKIIVLDEHVFMGDFFQFYQVTLVSIILM